MAALASTTSTNPTRGISHLPEEHVQEVVSFLSIPDFAACLRVCKSWRRSALNKSVIDHLRNNQENHLRFLLFRSLSLPMDPTVATQLVAIPHLTIHSSSVEVRETIASELAVTEFLIARANEALQRQRTPPPLLDGSPQSVAADNQRTQELADDETIRSYCEVLRRKKNTISERVAAAEYQFTRAISSFSTALSFMDLLEAFRIRLSLN